MTPEDKAQLIQDTLKEAQDEITRVEAEKQALIAEFSKAGSYDEQMDIAKKAIAELLPAAIHSIAHLLANAESEAVRSGLSKYVMETVLSGKLDDAGNTVVEGLLKQIAVND